MTINKSHHFSVALAAVCFCFVFVTGAFWDWNKKEDSKGGKSKPKTTQEQSPAASQKGSGAAASSTTVSSGSSSAGLVYPKVVQPVRTIQRIVPPPVKITPPMIAQSEVQQVQMTQLQLELRNIIERTRQLEKQAKVDRVKVDQILTQARIHEQILKNMTPPESAQTPGQVNLVKILEQEKLKLIAERAEQSQEELSKLEEEKTEESKAPAKSFWKKKS